MNAKVGNCLLFFCCVFFIILGASLGMKFKHSSPYKIECDTSYYFGDINYGKKSLEHEFIIKNVGKRNINIKKIKRNCSCIVPVLNNKLIQPDHEVSIRVTLNTKGYIGDAKGDCVVIFEEEDLKPIKLTLGATLYSKTSVLSNNKIVFGEVVHGESSHKKTCFLGGQFAGNLKIETLTSSSDFIEIKPTADKKCFVCRFNENHPVGEVDEKVYIDYVSKNEKYKLVIPVIGEVVGPYSTDQKELFLGRIKCGELSERQLTITFLKKGLKNSIITEQPQLLKCVEKDDNYERYRVTIVTPETPGFFEGVLSFRTSCLEQPLITIPYSGMAIK